MSHLAKQKLHGPVATLRTETATWDADQQDWEPARHFTIASFRPDGRINFSDTHIRDGSIAHVQYLYNDSGRLIERNTWRNEESLLTTVYFYDDIGRHIRTANLGQDATQTDLETCTYDAEGRGTKTRILHGSPTPEGGAVALGYSIEDADMAIGAPRAAFITTSYVERDRPAKVILEDTNHHSVKEVLFERDALGRLLSVETHLGSDSPFQNMADSVPSEAREQALAAFKKIFNDGFSRTSYVYDAQGRLLQQMRRMGTLSEDSTTYRYDDLHDEPIEEVIEHRSREANLDDNGAIHYDQDTVNVQHNRFEYIYDAHGNWTERTVSYQTEPNPQFLPSIVERRTITYQSA